MSAIAGCFVTSGANVPVPVLRSLSNGLRRTGPDGEYIMRRGSIGMVYRPFLVGAPATSKPRPFVSADGCMVGFAGRLDNGRDVARALVTSPSHDVHVAELVLELYKRCGAAGFASLVGDFAFALWEPTAGELVLACDPLGRCPLYYCHVGDRMLWCSRARALLEAAELPADLSEEYMADFLANRPPDRGPFRRIEALTGGHALVVTRSKLRLVRYWCPESTREIRYASDDQYEEHFRELFTEAVACRLEAEGPVFCELSGGLDSSAIACTADDLVRAGAVAASEIVPVSHVYTDSPTSDESSFLGAVEHRLMRPAIRISQEVAPFFSALPPSLVCDVPTGRLMVLSRYEHLSSLMAERQSRVVLCGIGGDQVFWSQPELGMPAADLLARGRAPEALRYCLELAHSRGRSVMSTFWHGAVLPLLPRRWWATFQGVAPVGEWFDRGFLRRTGLSERMLPMPDDVGYRLPSRSMQYGYIRRAVRPYALDPCLSSAQFELRYPFLDRRLVEFALAIPLDQMVRPYETRSIVRRSLVGVVPATVLRRRSKAGPEEAFFRAIARDWTRLSTVFDSPRLADLGVVDAERFRIALRRAKHGAIVNQAQLALTLSLELWLGHLEKHLRSTEIPRRPADGSTEKEVYHEGAPKLPAA